jgi:hypothetical protein
VGELNTEDSVLSRFMREAVWYLKGLLGTSVHMRKRRTTVLVTVLECSRRLCKTTARRVLPSDVPSSL